MENRITRKTAIIVDGGYYRVRAAALWGKRSPKARADELYYYCLLHIRRPKEPRDLYRIFYYDCPPMQREVMHPLTKEIIDFSKGSGTKWSESFYNELSKKRKLALRMGELAESAAKFVLKDQTLVALLEKEKTLEDLTEDDFRLDVKQKGVDMRIGLDVASLAKDHLVDQIVMIAGDSDFLPVVKMARKSGIDFLLDPMNQRPKQNMLKHIDGMESYTEQVKSPTAKNNK